MDLYSVLTVIGFLLPIFFFVQKITSLTVFLWKFMHLLWAVCNFFSTRLKNLFWLVHKVNEEHEEDPENDSSGVISHLEDTSEDVNELRDFNSNRKIEENHVSNENCPISSGFLRRRHVIRVETYEETILLPNSRTKGQNKMYSKVATISKDIWHSIPKEIEIYGENFKYRYTKILSSCQKAYFHCNQTRNCPRVGFFKIYNKEDFIDFFISHDNHDHNAC